MKILEENVSRSVIVKIKIISRWFGHIEHMNNETLKNIDVEEENGITVLHHR